MSRSVAILAGMLFALPPNAPAPAEPVPARDPRGPLYRTVPPMDDTVRRRIVPQVDRLLDRLLVERRAMTIDGIRVFDAHDRFLPGKIASAMAQRVIEVPDGDPRLEARLRDFAAITALTLNDANDSWGIYYYVAALDILRKRGLLTRAVSPDQLATLRAKLDWRRFVRGDMTLIDLPNNYYGVAFSVARMRNRLGWEDDTGYRALFARTVDHYRRYSGQYGFADETDGEGRFDRYSVLLIGEIAQRLIETDMPATPEIRRWLRRSVDLMLPRFNLRGEGFEYGRSIGVYGESAFLEVLTAAAALKVLTPTEERMAYAFSSRIAARYADVWLDRDTGSVNLWDHGRRTDAYRAKHRIFGENLSLARQQIYTDALWNRLGYRGATPDPDYARWLDRLPTRTTTWFARGTYDRLVVTTRDQGRVVTVPIVNGAAEQHMHVPYFPIPFSPGMLQGSPDATYPQLLPRITLTDGSVLMPLAFFEHVAVSGKGRETRIRWRQRALDRMGQQAPQADTRVAIETRYSLSPGRIVREDRLVPRPGVTIASVALEFATFSDGAKPTGDGATFRRGDVTAFGSKGYGACRTDAVNDPVYRTPIGPLLSVVRCSASGDGDAPIVLRWTLRYAA